MVHWCFGLEAYDFFLGQHLYTHEPYNENYPKRRGKLNESFFPGENNHFGTFVTRNQVCFAGKSSEGFPSSVGQPNHHLQSALDQDSSGPSYGLFFATQTHYIHYIVYFPTFTFTIKNQPNAAKHARHGAFGKSNI